MTPIFFSIIFIIFLNLYIRADIVRNDLTRGFEVSNRFLLSGVLHLRIPPPIRSGGGIGGGILIKGGILK